METNSFTNRESKPYDKVGKMTGKFRWVIGIMAMLLMGAGNVNAQCTTYLDNTVTVCDPAGGAFGNNNGWTFLPGSNCAWQTGGHDINNSETVIYREITLPAGSYTMSPTGTSLNGNVFIHGPGLTAPTYAGVVNATGYGATITDFLLEAGTYFVGFRTSAQAGRFFSLTLVGCPVDPEITVTPGSLSFYNCGSTPGAQSLVISGENLKGAITVGTLSGYEFSESSSGPFSTNQISITNSGTVTDKVIFIRPAGAGYNTTPITIPIQSFDGVSTTTNPVPPVTLTYELGVPFLSVNNATSIVNANFNYWFGSSVAEIPVQSFTVSGACLGEATTITVSNANFLVSTTGANASDFDATATLTSGTGTVWVRLASGLGSSSVGTPSFSSNISVANGTTGVSTVQFGVTGVVTTLETRNLYFSNTGANWDSENWRLSSCTTNPTTGLRPNRFDNVIMCGNVNTVVTVAEGTTAECASLTFEDNNTNSRVRQLWVNGSLTVYGDLIANRSRGGGNNACARDGIIVSGTLRVTGDMFLGSLAANGTTTINTTTTGGNTHSFLSIPTATATVTIEGNFTANVTATAPTPTPGERRANIAGTGTLRVDGNFNYGGLDGIMTAADLTLFLNGNNQQTITLGKGITVGTLRQSRTATARYVRSGAFMLGFTTYDQNCNPICLAGNGTGATDVGLAGWFNANYANATGGTATTIFNARLNAPSISSIPTLTVVGGTGNLNICPADPARSFTFTPELNGGRSTASGAANSITYRLYKDGAFVGSINGTQPTSGAANLVTFDNIIEAGVYRVGWTQYGCGVERFSGTITFTANCGSNLAITCPAALSTTTGLTTASTPQSFTISGSMLTGLTTSITVEPTNTTYFEISKDGGLTFGPSVTLTSTEIPTISSAFSPFTLHLRLRSGLNTAATPTTAIKATCGDLPLGVTTICTTSGTITASEITPSATSFNDLTACTSFAGGSKSFTISSVTTNFNTGNKIIAALGGDDAAEFELSRYSNFPVTDLDTVHITNSGAWTTVYVRLKEQGDTDPKNAVINFTAENSGGTSITITGGPISLIGEWSEETFDGSTSLVEFVTICQGGTFAEESFDIVGSCLAGDYVRITPEPGFAISEQGGAGFVAVESPNYIDVPYDTQGAIGATLYIRRTSATSTSGQVTAVTLEENSGAGPTTFLIKATATVISFITPTFTVPDVSKECPGTKIMFTIDNDGSQTEPVKNYQWLDGGSPIVSETGTTYELTVAADVHNISVRISGAGGLCPKTSIIKKVTKQEEDCDDCDGGIKFNLNFGSGATLAASAHGLSGSGATTIYTAANNYIVPVAAFNNGANAASTPSYRLVEAVAWGGVANSTVTGTGNYYAYAHGTTAANNAPAIFNIKYDLAQEEGEMYLLTLNAANPTNAIACTLSIAGLETRLANRAAATWDAETAFGTTPAIVRLLEGSQLRGAGLPLTVTPTTNSVRLIIDDIILTKLCKPSFKVIKSGECSGGDVTLNVSGGNIEKTGSTHVTYTWTKFPAGGGPSEPVTTATNGGKTLITSFNDGDRYEVVASAPLPDPLLSYLYGTSNPVSVTLYEPTTLTWTGDISDEWEDKGNWESTGGHSFVPRACDDVIIPTPHEALDYLPVLEGPAFCNNIHFEHGAAIGGQIYDLTYETASAEMILESTYFLADRADILVGPPDPRWYMLAPAFKSVESHDYASASSAHISYVRYFFVDGSTASWTDAIPEQVPLTAGQGVVCRAAYTAARAPKLPAEPGLTPALPFTFENRRFIIEDNYNDVTEQYELTVDLSGPGSTGVETSHELHAGYVLVGNPFMSYLSVEEFLAQNGYDAAGGEVVDLDVKLYDSEQKSFISSDVDDDPKWIAPFQAFCVVPQAGVSNELNLVFTTAMLHAKVEPAHKLRSSNAPENTLRIRATQDGYTSSDAVVRAKGGASNSFNPYEDATKLFSSESSLEVSTLADDKACDVNVLDRDLLNELLVPVNIKSAKVGAITLEINGAIGFTAADNIYLFDALTQTSVSLLDQNTFDIPKDDAENIDGRFFLQFFQEESIGEPTQVDNLALGKLYIGAQKGNVVVEARDEQILQVIVYDITGRKVLEAGKVNSTVYRAVLPGDAAYFVKVVTDKQVKTGKVIVK